MFEKKESPKKFPFFMEGNGDVYSVYSKEHFDYLNEKADMLYQTIHGYKSQLGFNYFESQHPQESNCFSVALIMDKWSSEHEFNQGE